MNGIILWVNIFLQGLWSVLTGLPLSLSVTYNWSDNSACQILFSIPSTLPTNPQFATFSFHYISSVGLGRPEPAPCDLTWRSERTATAAKMHVELWGPFRSKLVFTQLPIIHLAMKVCSGSGTCCVIAGGNRSIGVDVRSRQLSGKQSIDTHC